MSYEFPENFVWGAATAGPQIEGAAFEDGKGESIWDRFCRVPGKVANGDTLDVACDHYHRYREDCAAIRELGIRNYRMSIAWPRIYPNGTGAINEKGVAFYERLTDALLKNGITPWVTLFHWDLPQALEDRGGWRVRGTAEAFGAYAETVVRRLGDRVKHWMSLNEIPSFIGSGYGGGDKAPGADEPAQVVNQCYHHTLLAHGFAVRAVREHGGANARVGLVHNPDVPVPVSETRADIAAAGVEFERRAAQIMGPLLLGKYPEYFVKKAGADMPAVLDGDLKLIAQSADFLGLNVYGACFVRAGKDGEPEVVPLPKSYPRANVDWLNITPQAIYWSVRHASEIFGAHEIFITENGLCQEEDLNGNGEVLDLGRREFYRNNLIQLHRAMADGYKVGGFFAWSLMDNFEWAEGYDKRFGLVHVDYKTQKRTPKLSARWYSQVMRENRAV